MLLAFPACAIRRTFPRTPWTWRAFIADYARRNDGDVTAGADFLKGPLDTMPEIVDEALRQMQEFPQARRARVA